MANHTLTNTDVGPRGFWHQDRVVLVEAGDKVEVSDLTEDEVEAAKKSGYFKLDGGPLDHDSDDAKGGSLPGLTGKTKAELLDIAEKEGVTIEDGATVADIRSAIELHREA